MLVQLPQGTERVLPAQVDQHQFGTMPLADLEQGIGRINSLDPRIELRVQNACGICQNQDPMLPGAGHGVVCGLSGSPVARVGDEWAGAQTPVRRPEREPLSDGRMPWGT